MGVYPSGWRDEVNYQAMRVNGWLFVVAVLLVAGCSGSSEEGGEEGGQWQ